jgi:hypothetical protein
MTKIYFLVTVELPAEPPADRVEKLRDEIAAHAVAVVPFYTHQQPSAVTTRTDPSLVNFSNGMESVEFYGKGGS